MGRVGNLAVASAIFLVAVTPLVSRRRGGRAWVAGAEEEVDLVEFEADELRSLVADSGFKVELVRDGERRPAAEILLAEPGQLERLIADLRAERDALDETFLAGGGGDAGAGSEGGGGGGGGDQAAANDGDKKAPKPNAKK